jgi:hypothetical protein
MAILTILKAARNIVAVTCNFVGVLIHVVKANARS